MTKNDITGDTIRSRVSNENYLKNYEKIFKKSEKKDKPSANTNTSIT